MLTYTATIGRRFSTSHPLPGLRGENMSLSAWERFVEDVQADLLAVSTKDDAIEVHRGTGVWDGVEEESAKVTLLTPTPLPPVLLAELEASLRAEARSYGQDAIAFTVGVSSLL